MISQKVSIIVAVWNNAVTLKRCLDSIRNQSYPNIELIVMDNASSDGTQNIIMENSDLIAYWESKKDKGIYHAWNKALARTSGKWVCFLGGDDQWAYSDAIADMVEAGDKEGVNFVSGKLAYIDDRGQVTSEYGKPWSWSDIKSSHCIAHPGAFFHQSCFDANGRFDESYKIAGDYDFSLRLGRFVKPVFINKILVYMGDAGASRSRIFTVLKESWRAKATHPEVGRLLASITSLRTVLIIIGKKLRGRF